MINFKFDYKINIFKFNTIFNLIYFYSEIKIVPLIN